MINKPKRKKREAIIFLINAKDKMKLLRHCRKQDITTSAFMWMLVEQHFASEAESHDRQ